MDKYNFSTKAYRNAPSWNTPLTPENVCPFIKHLGVGKISYSSRESAFLRRIANLSPQLSAHNSPLSAVRSQLSAVRSPLPFSKSPVTIATYQLYLP